MCARPQRSHGDLRESAGRTRGARWRKTRNAKPSRPPPPHGVSGGENCANMTIRVTRFSSSSASLSTEGIKEPQQSANMSVRRPRGENAQRRRDPALFGPMTPHINADTRKGLWSRRGAGIKRSAWDEMEAEIAEPWPTGSSSRL